MADLFQTPTQSIQPTQFADPFGQTQVNPMGQPQPGSMLQPQPNFGTIPQQATGDGTGGTWTVDLPDITGTTVSVSALFSTEI